MPAAMSGIADYIWDQKYRFKNNAGEPIDQDVGQTFQRVARALAEAEQPSQRERWATAFYEAMEGFEVLPAGRILAGAGTGRKVTLLNCFVMGTIPDDLQGIYAALGESAMTMKQGGGIGMAFSTLRPNGALIESLGSTSAGPLVFMDSWDSMCRGIMSAGHRRGAMMATLRCDHPDIEAFIEAKRDPKRFRMFNLSVLVTDAFMHAVKEDLLWDLVWEGRVWKTVQARELWNKIMRSTYEFADPGVIFIDRVNQANPLRAIEVITASNPCGEQLLPPYGICCLGSLNLTRLVLHPFTRGAEIDWSRLRHLTQILNRMLDNVLDVTNYPLEAQRVEAQNKRRIGMGITGLADCLVMMGHSYNSPPATVITKRVMAEVRDAAEKSTRLLGEEKGSFPLFQPEYYYEGQLTHRRNSHLMSIQPTGTISLFAGNVSSGIEPIFDLTAKRRILQKDNSWKEVEVKDYAWSMYKQKCEQEGLALGLPGVWQTAADLEPEHHLSVLAAAQESVDSCVSKTINCPETITFDAFKDIYTRAYGLGAKSCTTYRPNEVTGSILSSDTMSVKGGDGAMGNVVELTKPLVRPGQLLGSTYRIKPGNVEHALFITINDIEVNGQRRPYEVFINTKNLEFIAWSTALTRMISAIFRKGGDIAFVTEELKAVFDPRGGYWGEDKTYVPSIIAGIGMVIEGHLAALGVQAEPQTMKRRCPKCQHGALVSKEGCWSCDSCTYSACG